MKTWTRRSGGMALIQRSAAENRARSSLQLRTHATVHSKHKPNPSGWDLAAAPELETALTFPISVPSSVLPPLPVDRWPLWLPAVHPIKSSQPPNLQASWLISWITTAATVDRLWCGAAAEAKDEIRSARL